MYYGYIKPKPLENIFLSVAMIVHHERLLQTQRFSSMFFNKQIRKLSLPLQHQYNCSDTIFHTMESST